MNNLEFLQLPTLAILKMKDNSLKVYALIYTQCKLNNNVWYHSYAQFAEELCVSVSYVKRAIKYLKDNGYITYECGKTDKQPNTYHIATMVKSEHSTMVKSEHSTMVKSEHSTMVKSEPQIRNNKKEINIDNNNNITTGTTDINYIGPANEIDDNTDNVLFVVSNDEQAQQDDSSIEYRQENERCWEQSFERVIRWCGQQQFNEAQYRSALNNVYVQWKSESPTINERMRSRMMDRLSSMSFALPFSA